MKMNYWSELPWLLCGLAYPDDGEVQRVAARCIKLYDSNSFAPGSWHAQSQRFLNKNWGGLPGFTSDPPLRWIMELVAEGELTIPDIFAEIDSLLTRESMVDIEVSADIAAKRNFVYWVSAFRFVSCLHLVSVPGCIV